MSSLDSSKPLQQKLLSLDSIYCRSSKRSEMSGLQKPFKLFTEGALGWNTKPHTVCLACYRSRRRNRRPRQTPEQQPMTQATLATDPISQIAAFQTTVIPRKRRHHYPRRGRATHATSGQKSHVVLDHYFLEMLFHPVISLAIDAK